MAQAAELHWTKSIALSVIVMRAGVDTGHHTGAHWALSAADEGLYVTKGNRVFPCAMQVGPTTGQG
jgi:hypothetical protein